MSNKRLLLQLNHEILSFLIEILSVCIDSNKARRIAFEGNRRACNAKEGLLSSSFSVPIPKLEIELS